MLHSFAVEDVSAPIPWMPFSLGMTDDWTLDRPIDGIGIRDYWIALGLRVISRVRFTQAHTLMIEAA
jgi:hypothetical protein